MDKLTQRLERTIDTGGYVADRAAELRKTLRRTTKPGEDRREKKLDAMLSEINEVMEDVRSLIAKGQWTAFPVRLEDSLRATSKSLQYERRQIKKMRRG